MNRWFKTCARASGHRSQQTPPKVGSVFEGTHQKDAALQNGGQVIHGTNSNGSNELVPTIVTNGEEILTLLKA